MLNNCLDCTCNPKKKIQYSQENFQYKIKQKYQKIFINLTITPNMLQNFNSFTFSTCNLLVSEKKLWTSMEKKEKSVKFNMNRGSL